MIKIINLVMIASSALLDCRPECFYGVCLFKKIKNDERTTGK